MEIDDNKRILEIEAELQEKAVVVDAFTVNWGQTTTEAIIATQMQWSPKISLFIYESQVWVLVPTPEDAMEYFTNKKTG